MDKLNADIFFLIIEKLQDDGKYLYSCLSVNRTLCEITVSILWKNPKKYFGYSSHINNTKYLSISNVILSYFSEESRNTLRNQGIDLSKSAAYQQQPLFDYISFWKYLSLNHLDDLC